MFRNLTAYDDDIENVKRWKRALTLAAATNTSFVGSDNYGLITRTERNRRRHTSLA